MNIEKIKRIWTSKFKILEGLWFNHVVFYFNKEHWATKLVENRRIQCYCCPFVDPEGSGPKAIIKGKPACGVCGCNILEKTACLSCDCALKEEGKTPRWEAVK